MKTVRIYLAKHPHENRHLMCWYQLNYLGKRIQFRSDFFVNPTEEEKLHEFHCNLSGQKLLDKCVEILAPHANEIMQEIERVLHLPAIEQIKNKHISILL